MQCCAQGLLSGSTSSRSCAGQGGAGPGQGMRGQGGKTAEPQAWCGQPGAWGMGRGTELHGQGDGRARGAAEVQEQVALSVMMLSACSCSSSRFQRDPSFLDAGFEGCGFRSSTQDTVACQLPSPVYSFSPTSPTVLGLVKKMDLEVLKQRGCTVLGLVKNGFRGFKITWIFNQ
jgi:hypothetical protein